MSNMIKRLKKRDVPPVKQVQLKLVRIDFWSAIRTGFTITVGLGIATIVGFLALWALVSFTPLFSSLNGVLAGFTGSASNIVVSLPQVLGVGFGLAVFNIVFGTLITGVSAMVYNIIARITGGIKIGFTSN
ncbi:MAG: hypothetical protein RLZZ380_811 [Actinomycetota bacterium]|jgi:hypothetical protein